ncbi:hypothetical protein Q1695_007833 [Nippostrongylus brasiliensis]|nr:hypothetical protein Q1695_007833 [Nippostrongylus brasiliensis]
MEHAILEKFNTVLIAGRYPSWVNQTCSSDILCFGIFQFKTITVDVQQRILKQGAIAEYFRYAGVPTLLIIDSSKQAPATFPLVPIP